MTPNQVPVSENPDTSNIQSYTFEVNFEKFKGKSDLSPSVVATWWQADKPNLVPLKAPCGSC